MPKYGESSLLLSFATGQSANCLIKSCCQIIECGGNKDTQCERSACSCAHTLSFLMRLPSEKSCHSKLPSKCKCKCKGRSHEVFSDPRFLFWLSKFLEIICYGIRSTCCHHSTRASSRNLSESYSEEKRPSTQEGSPRNGSSCLFSKCLIHPTACLNSWKERD